MTTKLIYTSPKRKTFVRIRNVLFGVLITLSILFRRKETTSFIESSVGQSIEEGFVFFFFTTIILVILFYYVTRRKKLLGILSMSDELLSIQIKNDTKSFDINQLKYFKVQTTYFIPNNGNVGLLSSYNNWLFFEYMGEPYKYQFVIDSSYKGSQFEELINLWDKKDNFTLIEKE